jgi:hypothetical protein
LLGNSTASDSGPASCTFRIDCAAFAILRRRYTSCLRY